MKYHLNNFWKNAVGVLLVALAVGLIGWQGSVYWKQQRYTEELSPLQTMDSTCAQSMTLNITAESRTTVFTQTETCTITDEIITTEQEKTDMILPLELNSATKEQLEQLPGIGAVLAERIVSYRTALGGFTNREQLLNVDGIGEKTFSSLFEMVYIENEIPQMEMEMSDQAPAIFSETFEEPEPQITTAEIDVSSITEPLLLDLNTASQEELAQLPGMTDALAAEVVEFRLKNQHFSSIYELLYINGITERVFLEVRDYVKAQNE